MPNAALNINRQFGELIQRVFKSLADLLCLCTRKKQKADNIKCSVLKSTCRTEKKISSPL